MKIAFITTMDLFPWAGSEELWGGVALSLQNQGHQTSVYYPRKRGMARQLEQLSVLGSKIHPFGEGSSWLSRGIYKLLTRKTFLPLSVRAMAKCKDWQNSDFIVVSQGACKDGLGWLEMIHSRNKDYAIICQANMESSWPNDETVDRMLRVYSAARLVCFVSEENERLFRTQTGYQGTNTCVVWNPRQPETPENPLPWPKQDTPLRMAMVGRIEPFAKGQDLLIEVLSQDKWRERDLLVTIYGKGDWEKTARRIIEQRGLRNIQFGGYATPEEIWSVNHIMALPSRHEGMALAMLEAMWLGRAVVATAVAGAVSEIIHGSNGFLAAAPSIELWDQAMEEAWKKRHLWPEIGQAAATRIRERIPNDPIKSITEKLLDIAKHTR